MFTKPFTCPFSKPDESYSLKTHPIVFHPRLYLACGLFTSNFPTKTFMHFFCSLILVQRFASLVFFDSSNLGQKLLSEQFSPVSCSCHPLRPKCLPQHNSAIVRILLEYVWTCNFIKMLKSLWNNTNKCKYVTHTGCSVVKQESELCDVNYTMPITSLLCLQGTCHFKLCVMRYSQCLYVCVCVCEWVCECVCVSVSVCVCRRETKGHHQCRLQFLVVTLLDRPKLTHIRSVAWLFHCSRFFRSISS
jgi:hypothetical protein